MEKTTVIINLNNKVIVRDTDDLFIWGQVQDISTDSLLIDFDIPQQCPQWIPFNRIFRPPSERAPHQPFSDHTDPYEPNPTSNIFAATRSDNTGPFIWKRTSAYHDVPKESRRNENSGDFVYREVAVANTTSREVVPYIRLFKCLFASGLSDKEILTSNPVSAATFCKTSHTADGFGRKWLKMASNPTYITLNRDGNRAVCLKIGRNSVTVIARENPYSASTEYGPLHQLDCRRFWDFFCEMGHWDCRSQEEWEKVQMKEEQELRRRVNHVVDSGFPSIGHLHQTVLIEVFNYLDTLHQICLKSICTRWYSILTHEAVTNHIKIFGSAYPPSWPNCGFVPLLTGNGWWYAGWKSTEYLTAKIANNISSNAKTLHLSGMLVADYEKLYRIFVGLRIDGIKLRTLILEQCCVEVGDFGNDIRNLPLEMHSDILYNPTSYQILFDISRNVALVDCTLRIIGQPFPKRDRRDLVCVSTSRSEDVQAVYSDLLLCVRCCLVTSVEMLVDKSEDMCFESEEDNIPLTRKRENIKKWIAGDRKVQGNNALDIMQVVQAWESTIRKTRKKTPLVYGNISTLKVDDLHRLTVHAMWRFVNKH